jgi:hypothetical protein
VPGKGRPEDEGKEPLTLTFPAPLAKDAAAAVLFPLSKRTYTVVDSRGGSYLKTDLHDRRRTTLYRDRAGTWRLRIDK